LAVVGKIRADIIVGTGQSKRAFAETKQDMVSVGVGVRALKNEFTQVERAVISQADATKRAAQEAKKAAQDQSLAAREARANAADAKRVAKELSDAVKNASNEEKQAAQERADAAKKAAKELQEIAQQETALARELRKVAQERAQIAREAKQQAAEAKKEARERAKAEQEATEAQKKAAQELEDAINQQREAIRGYAALSTAAFVGIAIAIARATNELAKYDQELANLRAVTPVTADELNRVKAAVESFGPKYGVHVDQATQATVEFVKAGVDLSRLAGGEIQDALALMIAGELEVGEAANYASGALNTYRDEHLKLKTVADIAAGAANASATSVREMTYANQALGPVASLVGAKFSEVNTVLAQFANNGLRGSDAGTSLKTALLALVNPTEEQKTVLKDLGLEFFDASGKLKSFAEIQEMLQNKLARFNKQSQEMILATIGGSDAVRALGIMTREGAEGFEAMERAMSQVTANETANTKMDSITGSVKQLGAESSLAASNFAETYEPLVRLVVEGLTKIVEGYNGLDSGAKTTINVTLLVGATMTALITVLLASTVAWNALKTAINGSTAAMAIFQRMPLVLGLTALASGIALVVGYLTKASEETKKFTEAQDALNQSIANAGTTTDAQRLQQHLDEAKEIDELVKKYESLKSRRDELASKGWMGASKEDRDTIQAIDDQLKELDASLKAHGVTIDNAKQKSAEMRDAVNGNLRGVIELTRAKVEEIAADQDTVKRISALQKEYNTLSAAKSLDAQQTARLRSVTDELRQLVPGLILVEGWHGRMTIENTGLLGDKVSAIQKVIEAEKQASQNTLQTGIAAAEAERKILQDRLTNMIQFAEAVNSLNSGVADQHLGDNVRMRQINQTETHMGMIRAQIGELNVATAEAKAQLEKIKSGNFSPSKLPEGTQSYKIPEKPKAAKDGKSAEDLAREADQARRDSYDRDLAYSRQLLERGNINEMQYVQRLKDIRKSYGDWLQKHNEELYQLDNDIASTSAAAAFKRVEDRKKAWQEQGRSAREIAQMEVESYTWIAGQETFLAEDRRRAEEALQTARREMRGSTFQVSVDWIEQEAQAMRDAGRTELEIAQMKYDAWGRVNSRIGQGVYNIEDEKRAASELKNTYRELIDVMASDLRRAREIDAKLAIEAAEKEAKAKEAAMEKRHKAEEKEIEDKIKALDKQAEAEKAIADQQERQQKIADLEAARASVAGVLDHEKIMLENGVLVKKKVADQKKLDEIDKQLAELRKEAAQKERDEQLRAERQRLQDELDAKREANEKELQELREKNEQKLEALRTWWETQLSEEKINSDLREAINRDGMEKVLENIKTYLGGVESEYKAAQERIMRLGGLIPPSAGIGSGVPTSTKDLPPVSAGKGTPEDLAKEQMRRNSEAWSRTTDPTERDRLHRENVRIGTSIGGKYDPNTGKWTFHTGVDKVPGAPGSDVPATVQAGERIFSVSQNEIFTRYMEAVLNRNPFERIERQMAAALSYQPPTARRSTAFGAGPLQVQVDIDLDVHTADPVAIARQVGAETERRVVEELTVAMQNR